ncbi:MAG: UDP-N-acetylglucosamine 2-epimerase [Allorhizobium sp.]
MAKSRICISTGTRADYGLLYWLMHDLRMSGEFELQIIASAMHLSPAFGETIRFIREDGFDIDEEVSCLDEDDSDFGMGQAYVRATEGFLKALNRLKPDLLIILGDRFEALAAATAATVLHIPIGHIHGGEITLGAVDDTFRHAITKMAHLHFTAAEEYARRIVQMGEAPARVSNVGAVGLDNFKRLSLPDRSALAADLGIDLSGDYALVTYHPATMEAGSPLDALEALLKAFEAFPELTLLVTKANADPGGRVINARLEAFQASQPGKVHLFASLGQVRYLAAMKHATTVVGNSSSGIIEAPAVDVPTVNIGSRQGGRLKAKSVIDVAQDPGDIIQGIRDALDPAFRQAFVSESPPYGRPGNATGAIISKLKVTKLDELTRKAFCDLPSQGVQS